MLRQAADGARAAAGLTAGGGQSSAATNTPSGVRRRAAGQRRQALPSGRQSHGARVQVLVPEPGRSPARTCSACCCCARPRRRAAGRAAALGAGVAQRARRARRQGRPAQRRAHEPGGRSRGARQAPGQARGAHLRRASRSSTAGCATSCARAWPARSRVRCASGTTPPRDSSTRRRPASAAACALGSTAHSGGADWPARLLAQLGRLYLAVGAWPRREALPPELQARGDRRDRGRTQRA